LDRKRHNADANRDDSRTALSSLQQIEHSDGEHVSDKQVKCFWIFFHEWGQWVDSGEVFAYDGYSTGHKRRVGILQERRCNLCGRVTLRKERVV